ncbi:hypothetical protein MCBMB27_01201 [Methylobacterium phyllosphaerae]|uniref:HTH HARE-type domain-containing protein n=2 Tax=Methylobacterium TaxID=407 RepID=A0AAE8L947_9HYPH|nr:MULTISPECIES: hypothetical protein [Methylobacterium]AIQ89691.1 protein of unassigned function [Methylobacterium oryzae CBMB20]APT30492.1 hypothetical protein MCBMB27_01201 [Methylobacterium phyllosphaerae]AWV18034.1 hypothetical protein A3862_23065 [Methylobacterium sp. XJLW]WFS09440.1 hypothetical protein P9K36_09205 [Methylobacterium sp. 391_Methyba4]SFH54863.1 hypothetical protein SAMN05192567_13116 [Methylobacterium phyllosphaerae]
MGLSESEIEARLAALRRQREALDRQIADLVLYLELGRRLGAAGSGARAASDPVPEPGARLRGDPADDPALGDPGVPGDRSGPAAEDSGAPRGRRGAEARPEVRPEARPVVRTDAAGARGAIPPAIAFTEDAAGARRYGRAVVEAACAAIGRAGRPLHAAEILEVLVGQGFTLPGRDPVAALNTRLWKRSGPGGPLSRVGEATYALAPPDPEPARGGPVTQT